MHTLSPSALADALAVRDLSDPAEGAHAIQTLVTDVTTALTDAWGAEVRLIRSPRVVTVADNYEDLGYPPDAVTRDARYSRYISADRMLRSHTSAGIPGALRALGGEADPPADALLAVPGVCYRRDSIDRLHTSTPQQLDLWRVTAGPQMTGADLADMARIVVETLLPGRRWRLTPADHPYTNGGRQLDVADGDDWVEVGECGLASPVLLRRSGLGDAWGGLAMGVGLDRLLMLRKGIPDVRLLRSTDPRVQEQMLDLLPYRPVSHMPPVRRDLSIAVDARDAPEAERDEGWTEILGDRVREALGPRSDLVESLQVLSETPSAALPAAAKARLGIRPGQVNLLVHLTLRALDRTLTDAEANDLRDQIYASLHAGSPVTVGLRT